MNEDLGLSLGLLVELVLTQPHLLLLGVEQPDDGLGLSADPQSSGSIIHHPGEEDNAS